MLFNKKKSESHIHTGYQVFVFFNFQFLFVDYINLGSKMTLLEDFIEETCTYLVKWMYM